MAKLPGAIAGARIVGERFVHKHLSDDLNTHRRAQQLPARPQRTARPLTPGELPPSDPDAT